MSSREICYELMFGLSQGMDRQALARHCGAARSDRRVKAARGQQQPGIAILANEIMHGTLALKVDEYKQVKALAHENLRDHMTDIEKQSGSP